MLYLLWCSEKWALAQPRGGFLGWLGGVSDAGGDLGTRRTANTEGVGENSVIEDMYKVGSGNMDIY